MSLQHDGCIALTELALGSHGAGLRALLKEKEGVEVFVSAMLLCAAEKRTYSSAQIALQVVRVRWRVCVARRVRACSAAPRACVCALPLLLLCGSLCAGRSYRTAISLVCHTLRHVPTATAGAG